MRIGLIIQARMSSSRLPGKVLMQIQGKTVLKYLLERIRRCLDIQSTIVATSTDNSDDPIKEFCEESSVECFRGSLENVAERFKDAALSYKLDAFVRICGDSPLLDPHLVDEHVQLFRQGAVDLVTNVANRTFPHGQSVEVLSTEVFCQTVKKMNLPEHLEQVTRYFYEHADEFVIKEIKCPLECNDANFVIDTPADFERITALIEAMDRPHWEYCLKDLLSLDFMMREVSAGY